MSDKEKIVIPGGTGFLGQVLGPYFNQRGYEVIILSRDTSKRVAGCQIVAWDGRTLGLWSKHLEGARAVINLAGRSVNCRYHRRNRKLLMDSRIESTRVVGEAIARCKTPPEIWLNSSTATIYKHSFTQAMDEETGVIGPTPEAKDAFSMEIATAWEQTFETAPTPQTRKVALRNAMVLDALPGTVFRVLRNLARFGLGGRFASGKQYMSWIHREDFCRAVEFVIEKPNLHGPVNIAAPNPLPNAEVMRLFRKLTGMPLGLPASTWILEMGAFFLRTETELIIKSRRVVPKRLQDAGFTFRYPHLQHALAEINARC